ncbi:MAG: hypothetical protein ACRDHM_02330 [Actinomycetota bacterium]
MSETTTPTDVPPRSRRLAVRFSLSLVAFAFISLMNRALTAALEEYSSTYTVPGGLIAAYVGFAVLAGVAFGFAAMLPLHIPTFHWRRALILAVLPAVIVALNILVFTSPSVVPEWLRHIDFLFGLQTATVGAALVGVAISAAFAEV